MSKVMMLLALAAVSVQAQQLDPNEALARALAASADLAAASQNDAKVSGAALRAREALTAAVEAMKAQPLCRPPPVIDPVTFGLLVEELERGNRTGTLSMALLSTTFQRHLLTVAQMKALLELVPRSSDRLQLLAQANHRLVDPESAGLLYALFPLKQDQRALALLLAQ